MYDPKEKKSFIDAFFAPTPDRPVPPPEDWPVVESGDLKWDVADEGSA